MLITTLTETELSDDEIESDRQAAQKQGKKRKKRLPFVLNLFWRTFLFLVVLLLAEVFVWLLIQGDWLGKLLPNEKPLVYIVACILVVVVAAVVARWINRPFQQLSLATDLIRYGDFESSQLSEEVATSEVRQVNIGFNRMTRKLARIEQDRAIMLAGISHDLRTPLARLRLETEMSVADLEARAHMVSDLAQLDAIIDKFLDYARPDRAELKPISLLPVVEACIYSVKGHPNLTVNHKVEPDLKVLADEVELGRILGNLIENARRYGKTPNTNQVTVDIVAKAREEWVVIRVRDHGTGVHPDHLSDLVKPFYRGDKARSQATGAGLGLAIVNQTVQNMGGLFALSNSKSSGLIAQIKLNRA